MTDLTVQNEQGETLDLAFQPGPEAGAPLVVLGHGVTANKDRPFLVALADALASEGLSTLRVSFSGNGASEGRFEDSTVTKEVADLGRVLDAAAALSPRAVAYVGHSMGGAVGVLRASVDERIRVLVSLAGMVETEEFCRRKFGELTPGRDTMWDKPECPLSQAYVDDMAAVHSVLPSASEVSVPWLLVHGVEDTVVPIDDSRKAADKGARTELVELGSCDHVFSGPATLAMVGVVVPWLTRRLASV